MYVSCYVSVLKRYGTFRKQSDSNRDVLLISKKWILEWKLFSACPSILVDSKGCLTQKHNKYKP